MENIQRAAGIRVSGAMGKTPNLALNIYCAAFPVHRPALEATGWEISTEAVLECLSLINEFIFLSNTRDFWQPPEIHLNSTFNIVFPSREK